MADLNAIVNAAAQTDAVERAAASASDATTPATTAAPAPATTPAPATSNTPPTTGTSSESIFTNNTASMTVIASSNYSSEEIESAKTLASCYATDMSTILAKGYQADKLTENEKYAAACEVVDANRWMMDNINETYLAAQIASDVTEAFKNSMPTGSAEVDTGKVADFVGDILDGAQVKEDGTIVDKSGAVIAEKGTFSSDIAKIISKTNNNEYLQFDENIRTDKIPAEIMMATDFDKKQNVKVPPLDILERKNEAQEQITQNIEFNAKDSALNINLADKQPGESNADYVERMLVEHYGLNNETVTINGEETNVASLDNLQGTNILNALSLEEGNNAIFKNGTDVDKVVESIISYANKNGGSINLATPNTTISVLSDAGMTQEEARDYVLSNQGNHIADLKVTADSFALGTNSNVTGYDILGKINYKDGTLADAYVGEDGKITAEGEALAVSALQQIAENNPAMKSFLENEGASMSASELLSYDYGTLTKTGYENINDGISITGDTKLILEDVQYITSKGATNPRTKAAAAPQGETDNNIETPDDKEEEDTTVTTPSQPGDEDPETTEEVTKCEKGPNVSQTDEEITKTDPPKGENPIGSKEHETEITPTTSETQDCVKIGTDGTTDNLENKHEDSSFDVILAETTDKTETETTPTTSETEITTTTTETETTPTASETQDCVKIGTDGTTENLENKFVDSGFTTLTDEATVVSETDNTQVQAQSQDQVQVQVQGQDQVQVQVQAQGQDQVQVQVQAQGQDQVQVQVQAQSQDQVQVQGQGQSQRQGEGQDQRQGEGQDQRQGEGQRQAESPSDGQEFDFNPDE